MEKRPEPRRPDPERIADVILWLLSQPAGPKQTVPAGQVPQLNETAAD
jgi:hypothetical protein